MNITYENKSQVAITPFQLFQTSANPESYEFFCEIAQLCSLYLEVVTWKFLE